MASKQLSRAEALAYSGYKHACHVMLYAPTRSQLFGRIPIGHIILMQMRFDGLLGFPGGLVDPSKETLEAGLSRELREEVGVAIAISEADHAYSCLAPPITTSASFSSRLMLHFYVKKMEEEQIIEVERAAVSSATDFGQEVLGMARVPLYTLRSGKGLGSFLSHSFIGNARIQLVESLLRLKLVAPQELRRALTRSLETHTHTAEDLKAALALTETKNKHF